MKEVYSRWPMTSGGVNASTGEGEGDLPRWALHSGQEKIGVRGQLRWTLAGIGLGVLTLVEVYSGPRFSAGASLGIGFAIVASWFVLFATMVRKLRRLTLELTEAKRWNDTLFERPGIALWREDWSAARDAVLKLLKAGVRDIEAYFAAHPDELREIRKQVVIKDVNAFAVKRINAPEKATLLGSLDSLLPDTDQTFIQWLIGFARGDEFYRSETHITQPDGTAVDTLFTAALPQDMKGFQDILVSDLDITEFKAAQAKLRTAEMEIARASRVTTLGALSASIAHEVNSPLAAIRSHAQASLRWLARKEPDIEEARAALDCVLSDVARAQGVVERTRAYLSNAPAATEPQDLAHLAREAVLLIETELRELGASVHIAAPTGLAVVLADAVNVQQVFVNLIMNAAQAMAAMAGPKDLTISFQEDAGAVRVAISDHGPGIPEDQQKTIFEPFYSTKSGGMGMGLAICKTCVSAHGGRIWVESTPGEGATFFLTLPTTTGSAEQAGQTPATVES